MPRTKIPGHFCCRGLTLICILCVNEKQWQTHTQESIGEGFEKVASGRIGRTIIGVGGDSPLMVAMESLVALPAASVKAVS